MIQVIKGISHEDWLKLRTNGLGSSEFGTALGFNPYCSPYKLAVRKREERAGHIEEVQNEAMIMGHLAEDMVAKRWEMATGQVVIKASVGDWIVKSDRRPYMQASPDRTYWIDNEGPRNEENKGILECKTTNLDLSEEKGSLITVTDNRGEHIIPATWYCQVQYLLACAKKKKGCLAWYRLMQRQFDYVYIDYDDSWFEKALQEVDVFWNDCILNGQDPKLTADDVSIKYPDSTKGAGLEVSEDIAVKVAELKDLKAQAKEIDSKAKVLEEEIKSKCTDAEEYTYAGVVLWTYKSAKSSTTFDAKRFQLENADLAEKYMVEKPGSRRFLLK